MTMILMMMTMGKWDERPEVKQMGRWTQPVGGGRALPSSDIFQEGKKGRLEWLLSNMMTMMVVVGAADT